MNFLRLYIEKKNKGGTDMNPEKFTDTDISREQTKKENTWKKIVAAAVCICIVIGAVIAVPKTTSKNNKNDIPTEAPTSDASGTTYTKPKVGFLSYEAVYPDTVKCPDYNAYQSYEEYDKHFREYAEYLNAKTKLPENYIGEMSAFYRTVTKQLLCENNGKNISCSPANIYMALSMLSEVTGGNSRNQILNLLGSSDIEKLRKQAGAVWESSYENDGTGTLVLANSFWLSDLFSYKNEPFEVLKNQYYASSFSGQMGSDDYTKKLQNWLNNQTGGLLKDSVGSIETHDDDVLELASTVYFKSQWMDKFQKEQTKEGTFNGADGAETCDFMHQSSNDISYYTGKGFSSICKEFTDRGRMWFILPDKGSSPEKLIAGGEAVDFVLSRGEKAEAHYAHVNLSIPKFDISSDIDLKKQLSKLGVTDIMSEKASDFSPMTDYDGIFISNAVHSVRVTVDEDGCTAAAMTVIQTSAESMPSETVDFTLDRPFIFAITNRDGLPLFFGIVNSIK